MVLAGISRGERSSIQERWEIEREFKRVLGGEAAVESVVEILEVRHRIDRAVTPMLVDCKERLDLFV